MAKKEKRVSDAQTQRDDALFESLGKSKRRKKRKVATTVIVILLILAIVAVVGVGSLQRRIREKFAAGQGEVKSYAVTTGSISTLVSGSGSLTDVDLEAVTVPVGVEITEVLVKRNQTVVQGDLLATVDMDSVMSAMADLQSQIQALDDQLSDAEDDAADTTIYAGVTGRIKKIYGAQGADVADVMYENGALALISLDGYMAVDLESQTLAAGDSVKVVLSDEKEVAGTVEAVNAGVATVLVRDDGPAYGDTVTVLDAEGNALGSGQLYIHSALRVTGYAGTIASVKVKENAKVKDTTKLFTLEDTGYSANYTSLLRQRATLEESLLELLAIKRDGAILAPISGSVYSVDHTENGVNVVTLSPDRKMSVTIRVDESDILSLELGQAVTVTVSSVSEDDFEGTLTEINRTTSASGTYSATIEVEKVSGMLSGMTASVSVRIQGVDDAILIPIEALHKTGDGAYVYTSYSEEYQEYGGKVDVVTGLENSSYVEIKSGLQVGDTVYYTEQTSIFDHFANMGGMDFEDMPSGDQRPDFGGQMPNGGFPGGFGG